ncbi:hypothetical protein PBCV1_a639L [Paramecium bursaria Chlorella virus 1]|uniref:Uncharacterized protein n=1 Tax=Paramecium bursaria Chlorella virus 1 TaxID=10506 RepID=O41121_PBCV1|nr:hypothetical protein PBCV1_a639L [Paramecium bursaria Chlorella virus 1]AAC97032.1 hypothetical protein [Paramecium bursaria Chlorella virus 1]
MGILEILAIYSAIFWSFFQVVYRPSKFPPHELKSHEIALTFLPFVIKVAPVSRAQQSSESAVTILTPESCRRSIALFRWSLETIIMTSSNSEILRARFVIVFWAGTASCLQLSLRNGKIIHVRLCCSNSPGM